jgi:hypothetical protein
VIESLHPQLKDKPRSKVNSLADPIEGLANFPNIENEVFGDGFWSTKDQPRGSLRTL